MLNSHAHRFGSVLFAGFLVVGCSSNAGDDSTDAGTDGLGTDAATDGSDDATSDAPIDTSMPLVDSGDGFGAARTACINEINSLRSTEGHAAYALWTGAAIDMCVDEQASSDEKANSPHQAWLNGTYPTCNGNGQNECEGFGVSPADIVKCLDAMWAEKNQPDCAGCPACQAKFTANCPNCDFYGKTGPECGHYVNMSADYFVKAACGFSSLGGWAVQNFSQ